MSAAFAGTRSSTRVLVLVGVVWFALAYIAAAVGLVDRPATEPPLRIALAAGIPVLAVAVGLLTSRRLRWFAATLDLPLLINLQALRAAGFTFLVLYAADLLPGGFAFPAGLGDLAVALTAPFVARYVVRRTRAAWPVFLGWTLFGIADFIMAVALGAIHDLGAQRTAADATIITPPMAELPLSLIPTFAVPFLLVVHLLAIARFRADEMTQDPSLNTST